MHLTGLFSGVAECEDEFVGAIGLWLPHNLDGVGTGTYSKIIPAISNAYFPLAITCQYSEN